ncbi:MAG: UDP-N-acetylglucosamine 2-epimerase [Holophagaceae bacterium]|nr:UDP-N-acetylglucosamine 2-epimerase [Holophagaceae bacterium]
MAPVYKALRARGARVAVLHTGQHEAVASVLYDFFEMPPDIVIDLQRKSASLAHLTSALLDGVEDALRTLDPDVVMVQGDTSSAFVGALAAYYRDKPVAHVEAGLRTGQRDPFPEEKNRELIGRLAHWHFPPTPQARRNLLAEGISTDRIFEVGNTVIDAALWTRERIMQASFDLAPCTPPGLMDFQAACPGRRMILVTAHRRENWGQPIRNIAKALATVIREHPETVAIWPVHPNPAVRADVEAEISMLPPGVKDRICLTEPLIYPVMIDLLARCAFTLTDSGGIQEEASAFAKPVLVARDCTERQELVEAGGARLVGTDMEEIVACSRLLLHDEAIYRSMQLDASPFGDGRSAWRIAEIVGVGK